MTQLLCIKLFRLSFVLSVSVMTVVVFSGLARANEPVSDPECHALVPPDPVAIVNLNVDTDKGSEHTNSQVLSSGLACGTVVTAGGGECMGKRTLYEKSVTYLPPGARYESTDNVPSGSFAASAGGRSLRVPIRCKFGEDPEVTDSTASLEARPTGTGDCPGEASEVACFFIFAEEFGVKYAESWGWVNQAGDSQTFTFGPTVAVGGIFGDVTTTKFSIDSCERYGAPNQQYGLERCGGEDDDPVFFTGDSSYPVGCTSDSGPQGEFTVIGTLRNGQDTTPGVDCVYWLKPLRLIVAPAVGG